MGDVVKEAVWQLKNENRLFVTKASGEEGIRKLFQDILKYEPAIDKITKLNSNGESSERLKSFVVQMKKQ